MPGNGEGAYATHHYRDLFAEQGHTPAESRATIDKAFQQIFHGDDGMLYLMSMLHCSGNFRIIEPQVARQTKSAK